MCKEDIHKIQFYFPFIDFQLEYSVKQSWFQTYFWTWRKFFFTFHCWLRSFGLENCYAEYFSFDFFNKSRVFWKLFKQSITFKLFIWLLIRESISHESWLILALFKEVSKMCFDLKFTRWDDFYCSIYLCFSYTWWEYILDRPIRNHIQDFQ